MSYDPTSRSTRELLADFAAIMRTLREDFRVVEALLIERETVEALFRHRAHVNGRVITITDKLRNRSDVQPIELSDRALDA